jgi:hypothetical protein
MKDVLMNSLSMNSVLTKPLLAALFAISIAACSSAIAQTVPAATGSGFQLSAGALGSILQPDFSYSNGIGTSPNRVYGVAGYADFRFSRWIQLEAEARFSRFNVGGEGNSEDTYLAGPRIPIYTFHKMHATPYAKFLVGWGRGSGFLNPPTTLAMAYGGGLDLRMSKHFTFRAFDFEYQQWRVAPTLYPYEGSVGLSYRIF